jgi:hypothetical protein
MSKYSKIRDLTQALVYAESEINKIGRGYRLELEDSIKYIIVARSEINRIILGKNGKAIESCKLKISLAKILAYRDIVKQKINALKDEFSTFAIFIISKENRDAFSKIESKFVELKKDIVSYESYEINKENNFISDFKSLTSSLEDLDTKVMNDKKEKSIKIPFSFILWSSAIVLSLFSLANPIQSSILSLLIELCLVIIVLPSIIIYFYIKLRKSRIKNFLKSSLPLILIIIVLGLMVYSFYINSIISYNIPQYAHPNLGIDSPDQISCKIPFNVNFSIENKGTIPLQITNCLALFNSNALSVFNTTILQANETSKKTFNFMSPEKAGYYDILLLCSFNQTNIFSYPGIKIITVNC